MQRDGLTREFIRAYMPVAADWAGSSADENSAYAYYAPEVLFPWKNEVGEQIFPGGNTGIARFIVKAMIPEAMPGPNTWPACALARWTLPSLIAKVSRCGYGWVRR